jgi:general nucleoside transport system ATP-binding protein
LRHCESGVALRHITKTFPGIIANDNISIDFRKGEIHALLGENGAGKSTLMNILTGIYRADSGEIDVEGHPVHFRGAADAIASGIGMVHQHFKLVMAFTVAQNIHIGWRETPLWLSHKDLSARTVRLAEEFGMALDPNAVVGDLSAGEQQRVEIVRVLARGARVLIVDEPTAVLSPREVTSLFTVLRRLRVSGRTVIFISHKLNEVLDISDRVTILRRGRVAGTCDTAEMDIHKLASIMVGREVIFSRLPRSAVPESPRRAVLRLDGVSVTSSGRRVLRDVSLSVRSGEILGIAGVAGNGQRTLTEVIAGMVPPDSGSVEIDGRPIVGMRPDAVARLGVGHIPEDRLKSGFAGALSIVANAVLRCYRSPPVSRGGWFSGAGAATVAETLLDEADVSVPDLKVPLRGLSGGNQQRLIARRECRIARRLLIAAYPMRGLDVGAVERLRAMLMQQREAGAGVILISEEIDELLELADRIAVMHHGCIAGTLEISEATPERIGLLMGGERDRMELPHV